MFHVLLEMGSFIIIVLYSDPSASKFFYEELKHMRWSAVQPELSDHLAAL